MLFRILRLRDRGWLLPRFRLSTTAITARLHVAEQLDAELNRTVRVAKLLDPTTGAPLDSVPPLRDCVLVHFASEGRLSLSGVEHLRDDLGTREIACAQSWILTCADDPDSLPAAGLRGDGATKGAG